MPPASPQELILKEVRRKTCEYLRTKLSKKREEQRQRPWGRSVVGLFEEESGGQCGWNRVGKGEGRGRGEVPQAAGSHSRVYASR